jgi:hypothetical protein
MDKVLEYWGWLQANYKNVLLTLAALVAFLEAFVRMTPTKSDDGAVHRIGQFVDWLLELAHIPNVNKIQTFKALEPEVDPKANKPS